MFKKRYQIIEKADAQRLAEAVELEMQQEGWVPLGGAIWVAGDTYRWAQAMWLPEDPHATGLVPGQETAELLMEEGIALRSTVNFAGTPPIGDFEDGRNKL